MREPIVLAFSGGLDTSFCVPWLAEAYGRPVVTVTVDTGGLDAAAVAALGERSRRLGAVEHRLVDGRDAFFERVLRFLVSATCGAARCIRYASAPSAASRPSWWPRRRGRWGPAPPPTPAPPPATTR